MPGERARIEDGLKRIRPDEVCTVPLRMQPLAKNLGFAKHQAAMPTRSPDPKVTNCPQLKKHIAEAIKSVNGLAAAAAIFHPGIMPERVALDYCVRCRKHYDSRFASEAVCKMPHPVSCQLFSHPLSPSFPPCCLPPRSMLRKS
jgi:hypothetical protein